MQKILIIRAGMLGDVLMSTPLVSSIRKRHSKAEIHYLVGEWSKSALQGNKDIDRLVTFDDSIIFERRFFKVLGLIKRLRKERFDLCIVLDKSYLWNIFAFLTGSKTRIGFNRGWEGFLNNKNVDFDGSKYELDYYIELARLMGIKPDNDIKLIPSKSDEKFAESAIKKYHLKNKILIGIAPGGARNPGQEMAVKRWPKERYSELINKLSKNKQIAVILFGGKEDISLAGDIINKAKGSIINLTGKSTIPESAALIKRCRLFITHDSGLMHLAAAVKTPVIALFGPTPSIRFAPKGSVVIKSHLKCSPCYDMYGNYKKCEKAKCMESITVNEVESAINSILNKKARNAKHF